MMRPFSTLRSLSTFAILCALAASAVAQEVGDEVVVKTDKAVLRSNKGQTAIARGELLFVLKVETDQFLARLPQGKKGQAEGWINRADVLALSPAIEVFTDELKRQPTAGAYAI